MQRLVNTVRCVPRAHTPTLSLAAALQRDMIVFFLHSLGWLLPPPPTLQR
jgi:hypothetical protein